MSLLEDLKKIDEIQEIVVTAPKQEQPILQQAVSNLPSSTYKLGKDLVEVIINPVTTAKSIFELGKGVVELAIPGEQESEETAKAVGRYFANRYGGLENIKKTFAQDPAGFLADASVLLTGGGTLGARVPQIASTAEKIAKVGTAIDPVTGLVKATQAVSKPIATGAREILGTTTGVGGEAITQALQAGRIGEEAQARFINNLRGRADPMDVANRAFDALKRLGSERAAQYTHGIQGLKLSEKPVNFDPINDAIKGIIKESTYRPKGAKVSTARYSPSTMKKIDELEAVVSEFADEAAFHTAEGMDILKRKVDDLYPLQAQASQEGKVVAELRNKIKEQIVKQVPEYADVMKPYEEALKLEKELVGELSLGRKAKAGTTLRKLQSTMRNNVNTAYGNRLELLNKLDPELLPDLSGQALSELAPRGLQRAVGGGAAAYGAFVDPSILLGIPLQSPRLVGETALKYGQMQRILGEPVSRLPITPTLRGGRLVTAATEEEKTTDVTNEELEKLSRMLD